jgi:hypothetical protein
VVCRGMVTPMTDDAGSTRPDPADLAAALGASLAVAGEQAGDGPVDVRSLTMGLRVGLRHPELARHLLETLNGAHAAEPAASVPSSDSAASVPSSDSAAPGVPSDAPEAAAGDALGDDGVPVASQLLARAARLPHGEARPDPEVLFSWALRLLPSEIPAMGRIVQGMLADGAAADTGRGFGLAWSAGVRLPHRDVDRLFADFTELELTVCSVLAGHDLRDVPPASGGGGIGRVFSGWFGGSAGGSPASREADAVLDRGGRVAQLGLVATWNAWMAMRYRDLVPEATFDLLVRPWIRTLGPLPPARD